MRRAARQSPLLLLVTALVVLAGVLGMHAASAGPHASPGADHAVTAWTPGDAGETAPSTMSASTAEEGTPPRALAAGVGEAAAGLAPRARPDRPVEPSSPWAAVCVAILLSLVVRRATGTTVVQRPVVDIPRRPPLSRTPLPDLLTRLCVLRT